MNISNLSPQDLVRLCLSERRKQLEERPVLTIIRSLGRLSRDWLGRDFPYRRRAVAVLTRCSGYSEAMAQALLDSIFSELTEAKLLRLLRAEIRDPRFLDGFRRDEANGNWSRASGPRLVAHIFAGNVPSPAIFSFVLGMLVKCVNIGKPASDDPGVLAIYLQSLALRDPHLGRTNALIDPADRKFLHTVLKSADLVVAYGKDETLERLRREVPARTPFIGYGHRWSFAFFSRKALAGRGAARLAEKTAHDVWMADQRGCLSPLVVFAEHGGEFSPMDLAGEIARHLERLSERDGARPEVSLKRAAGHESVNQWFRMRRLKGERVRAWFGRQIGRWAVTYDEKADALPPVSGGQLLCVKGVYHEKEIFHALLPHRAHLQAAAVEGTPSERRKWAEALARLGANRVTRAGRMQRPPVTWHHDGRPNLAGWLRWTDLED